MHLTAGHNLSQLGISLVGHRIYEEVSAVSLVATIPPIPDLLRTARVDVLTPSELIDPASYVSNIDANISLDPLIIRTFHDAPYTANPVVRAGTFVLDPSDWPVKIEFVQIVRDDAGSDPVTFIATGWAGIPWEASAQDFPIYFADPPLHSSVHSNVHI